MYIPDSYLLRGLSVERARCYGMSHIGAYYSGRGVRTNRLDPYATCALCGRPATNSHHVPNVGMGGGGVYLLHGCALRPALIALCGSGTTGCHGMMHDGSLRASWAWDDEEAEMSWWNGDILRHVAPHSHELYELGEWHFISSDGEIVATHRG